MPSAKSAKSKRARKRRRSASAPRAVASERRSTRAERDGSAAAGGGAPRRAAGSLGREGERPPGLFGGVPVSEIAILAGIVSAAVGFFGTETVPLVVGLVICALGVMEVTGREHFSGYRSHTLLLAAIPAVAVEAAVALLSRGAGGRGLLLLIVVPVFAVLFWALRRRFTIARQARVARAARGTAPSA